MSKEMLAEIDRLLKKHSVEKHGSVREAFYLNNWYRFKKNIKVLEQSELEKAKTLFRALKELHPEDRALLAMKYDKPKHIVDKVLAENLNRDFKEYVKEMRRIKIELKLIMLKQKLEE